MVPVLLGIDLGTSSLKTILIEPDGRMLACAAREYAVDTPQPGWAEQQPETWYQAAVDTIRQALEQSGTAAERVAGIGLSGQMHGTVCLDASGRPLRPAIIWADQRSVAQVDAIKRQIGPEQLGAWTANPLATGFMLATWLWLREHEPQTYRAARYLLLPKDYLRFRLTGELGSEPSDASSTLMFDTARRCWSTALLDALDIDPAVLPAIHESADIAGGLDAGFAAASGLPAGTPVVFGGSDQALQAIGNGLVSPGMLSSTIGTGGQLFAPVLNPTYDPALRLHCFCHALPGLWHLEAGMLAAGLSLKWMRDNLFAGASYQLLSDEASEVPPGAEGLLFAPYLAGERTPHMDPHATGSFVGLTLRHHRAHLVRAAMEGVVMALRQGLELMLDLGASAGRVVASGGATRHPLWLQLQADVFARPIHRTRTTEAAALGAATLAGVGVELYPDVHAACARLVCWDDQVIQPLAAHVETYERIFPTFCAMYPTLRRLRAST